MLYLIILSTLSSDSKRRGSLVRAQGRCNGGRGRAYVVLSQESGAKNSLQPVRYYKDKKKQTSAAFFCGDERHDDKTGPRAAARTGPYTPDTGDARTLGMRSHWGCAETCPRAWKPCSVLRTRTAKQPAAFEQESSHRLRLLGRVRGQLVVDEKVHIDVGEPGVEAGDHIHR